MRIQHRIESALPKRTAMPVTGAHLSMKQPDAPQNPRAPAEAPLRKAASAAQCGRMNGRRRRRDTGWRAASPLAATRHLCHRRVHMLYLRG